MDMHTEVYKTAHIFTVYEGDDVNVRIVKRIEAVLPNGRKHVCKSVRAAKQWISHNIKGPI